MIEMVENNSPIILNCSFNDSSITDYYWVQTLNETGIYYVSTDSRVQLLNNGTSLYFTYVVPQDQEFYSCVGLFQNGTNKILTKYFLYVKSKIYSLFDYFSIVCIIKCL